MVLRKNTRAYIQVCRKEEKGEGWKDREKNLKEKIAGDWRAETESGWGGDHKPQLSSRRKERRARWLEGGLNKGDEGRWRRAKKCGGGRAEGKGGRRRSWPTVVCSWWEGEKGLWGRVELRGGRFGMW